MNSQQRSLLASLLSALSLAQTLPQVKTLWEVLESVARQLNIQLGTEPTSVPQARSIAATLKRRYV